MINNALTQPPRTYAVDGLHRQHGTWDKGCVHYKEWEIRLSFSIFFILFLFLFLYFFFFFLFFVLILILVHIPLADATKRVGDLVDPISVIVSDNGWTLFA